MSLTVAGGCQSQNLLGADFDHGLVLSCLRSQLPLVSSPKNVFLGVPPPPPPHPPIPRPQPNPPKPSRFSPQPPTLPEASASSAAPSPGTRPGAAPGLPRPRRCSARGAPAASSWPRLRGIVPAGWRWAPVPRPSINGFEKKAPNKTSKGLDGLDLCVGIKVKLGGLHGLAVVRCFWLGAHFEVGLKGIPLEQHIHIVGVSFLHTRSMFLCKAMSHKHGPAVTIGHQSQVWWSSLPNCVRLF